MIDESYIVKHYTAATAPGDEKLSLSAMVCPDGFMYAISADHFGKVIELAHIQFKDHTLPSFALHEKVAFVVQNYGLQKKKFEKVVISVMNHDFTMIPTAFASSTDLKKLIGFATGKNEVKNGMHKQVANLDLCYTIDHDLLSYIEKAFPNAVINHSGSISISSFFTRHSVKGNDIFLLLYSSHIELLVKQGQNLLFYNVFGYQNNEDVLYYILFTMEQFSLNPLYTKLVVASQQGVSDELVASMKKYIRQVSFCVNDASVKLSGGLSSLPSHYYFNLLNQHLCEL